jgi:uncharacterized pyridoxamine 5'-phosphate oxidase family protein
MDLFKITKSGKKVYVRILSYNERVWSGSQWDYRFVRIGGYPINDEKYATDFKTVEAAEQWIKEHQPS